MQLAASLEVQPGRGRGDPGSAGWCPQRRCRSASIAGARSGPGSGLEQIGKVVACSPSRLSPSQQNGVGAGHIGGGALPNWAHVLKSDEVEGVHTALQPSSQAG